MGPKHLIRLTTYNKYRFKYITRKWFMGNCCKLNIHNTLPLLIPGGEIRGIGILILEFNWALFRFLHLQGITAVQKQTAFTEHNTNGKNGNDCSAYAFCFPT